jgi:hypothetical protein
VHLILAFHYGKMSSLLPPSAVRQKDWILDWKPRWPVGDANVDVDSDHELDYVDEIDPNNSYQGLEGQQEINDRFVGDEDWVSYYVNM